MLRIIPYIPRMLPYVTKPYQQKWYKTISVEVEIFCVIVADVYESDGTGGVIEQRQHNVLLCELGRGAQQLVVALNED